MSLLDMCFGLPWMDASSVEAQLFEERQKFLVAELSCLTDEKQAELAAYMRRIAENPFSPASHDSPPIPFRFRFDTHFANSFFPEHLINCFCKN